jgi:uncharacterized membrane protein YciS (DUF1049 family)
MRFLTSNGYLLAIVAVVAIWLLAVTIPASSDCAKRHGVLVRGFTVSGLACVAPPHG